MGLRRNPLARFRPAILHPPGPGKLWAEWSAGLIEWTKLLRENGEGARVVPGAMHQGSLMVNDLVGEIFLLCRVREWSGADWQEN